MIREGEVLVGEMEREMGELRRKLDDQCEHISSLNSKLKEVSA
jgi:hypothetical protein